MKEWIISIGATIIITSVASMILPQGKMGAYVKAIFSFLLVLVILKPLMIVNLDEYTIENYLSTNTIEYQIEYLNFVINKRIIEHEEKCNEIIEKAGVKEAKTTINYAVNVNFDIVINKVEINMEKAVFISEKEHINIIEEIKTALSNYLSVEYEKVIIYE